MFYFKYFSVLDFFLFFLFFLKLNLNFFTKKTINFTNPSPQLFYGLIEVHPFFFYFSFILCIYYTFFFNIQNKKISIFFSYKNFLSMPIFALISGGYWSFFNSSWGYWWVWDKIEIVLLVFFIVLVFYYHKNFFVINFFKILLLLIFNINIIYLIRVGFYTSRHSFFLNNNSLLTISQIYSNFFIYNTVTVKSCNPTVLFFLINNFFYNFFKILVLFIINFFYYKFFLIFLFLIFFLNILNKKVKYHLFVIFFYFYIYLFITSEKFSIFYKINNNLPFYLVCFNKSLFSLDSKKSFVNVFENYYYDQVIFMFADPEEYFWLFSSKYNFYFEWPAFTTNLESNVFFRVFNLNNYNPTAEVTLKNKNSIFFFFEKIQTLSFIVLKKFDFLSNIYLYLLFCIINCIF